jgi:hypothetical protein
MTDEKKEAKETLTQSTLALNSENKIQQETAAIAKQETKQETKIVKQSNDDFLRQVVIAQIQTGELATLDLTKEQEEILYAPVQDDEVDIRPDGLVFASWTFYATRLRRAFGMKWALLPASQPKATTTQDGKPCIVWDFYLFVGGKYVAYAVGEHIEERMGRGMSYTESLESAKSNALMRCCKQIGIGLELWDRNWIEIWKKKYAETYEEYKNGYKKIYWRRKRQTAQPVAKSATQSNDVNEDDLLSNADLSRFWTQIIKAKITKEQVHKILKEEFGLDSVKQIPRSELDAIAKAIIGGKEAQNNDSHI